MKRLYKLRLSPLLAFVFLLPVQATESRIIEGSLRDQYFLISLKERSRFDCCAPIVHRTGIHPHILDDCGLLVTGYLKKKDLKRITVPSCIRKLLVKYLAGDFDRNNFDQTSGVNNDTGCFLGWRFLENYFGCRGLLNEPSNPVKFLIDIKGITVYKVYPSIYKVYPFIDKLQDERCCKTM